MIFLYIIALILSFYILAKVVDEYFVDALDKIAEKLNMSSDAAGATLMAVGSSAPELFVAIFAVMKSGDHAAIGVGNIVGSALFNILAITGAAAIIKNAKIAWQAVARDLFFYMIAILMLLFTLHDGILNYFEAFLLIGTYIIYVVVVIFWKKIFNYTDDNNNKIEEETNIENNKNSIIKKITSPVDFVINLIFPNKKHYNVIFLISIIIIAGISWILVESAIEIAHFLNISEAIIAVTILAVGTSIPDLISSIVVSKQGRGGMAISNAVGSNIFDILIGLGLPFLIVIISLGGEANIDVGNIEISVYFLLASVFIVFLLFILNKWKVGKIFGSS
ncbi:MAG: calcium/sodium antiporter, partial [Chlorobi bacterium]|nr:calcium/sodium antiporter [Chlorobiota bacterium]